MDLHFMVRQIQLTHFGLFMGPTMFLGVIFFLAFDKPSSGEEVELLLARNMVLISFVVYLVSLGVSKFLFPPGRQKAVESEFSSRLAKFQTNHIIRTALAEAGVLSTLAGFFLYITAGGALFHFSTTWFFFFSYFAFVLIWGSYLPTKEKISDATGIPLENLLKK